MKKKLCLLGLLFVGFAQAGDKNISDKGPFVLYSEIEDIVKDVLKKSLAFVDALKILEQLHEFKDSAESVNKDIESRLAQAKSLQEAGVKKQQELEKMGNALSTTAKERIQQELAELEAQYNIKMRAVQEFAQRVQQELQMSLLKKIQDEADEYCKEKGMLLVIGGGIVYGAKPLDLTDIIVERLNKKYDEEKKKKSAAKSAGKKVAEKPAASSGKKSAEKK